MTTAAISSPILDTTKEKGAITINDLLVFNQLGHIRIPDYQRGEVWNNDQKRKFICSILDQEPSIPHITIHRDGDRINIVDGQQRIKAILAYLSDDLILSKPLLEENGLDESLKGKFSKLPEDMKQRVLSFALDYKVTADPRKSFLRLQNAKPLNNAERNHALACDLNRCLADLTEEYADLISRCGFGNKRFKADEVFAGCVYMAVYGHAANAKNAIQTFYRTFDSQEYEDALKEVRTMLDMLDHNVKGKHPFLGAANFRALFLLFLKSDFETRAKYRDYMDDFLTTCADNDQLKSARNRLGEEHMQKDAIEEALKRFIEIEEAKPIDEVEGTLDEIAS